jgi:hypothetical protein
MNRRKFILRNGLLVPLLVALPSVAFPQILLQGRKAVRFPPAGGGGASQYYYPFGLNVSSFAGSSALNDTVPAGDPITCGAAGTCTKLGVEIDNGNVPIQVKLCLYDATYNLLAGAVGTPPAFSGLQWFDVTISAAVSAATVYNVVCSPAAILLVGSNASNSLIFFTEAYSTSCSATIAPSNFSSLCIGVRMYV